MTVVIIEQPIQGLFQQQGGHTLTAVVGVAVRYGLLPSMLASVAASLCYNFFFMPPFFTFTIADPTTVPNGRSRGWLR